MQLDTPFEALYKQHYKSLLNAAHNIVGDKDNAHDIVQEVFLKLWSRRSELSAIVNHKAYLFKSVVNSSLTWLEKNRKNVRLANLHIEGGSNPGSDLIARELESKISNALNHLPPKCKAVFVLSRFEDMKNKEIASVLGLSVKTVENQMGIAIKKMRGELRPYLGSDFPTLLCLGWWVSEFLTNVC